MAKRPLLEILPEVEPEFLDSVRRRERVFEYIMEHGKNDGLKAWLEKG